MAFGSPRTQCYIWEWQRDDGGFSPYPADVIQVLEDQFNKTRTPSLDLQLLPNSAKARHPRLQEYVVDFTAMEQEHKESGYRRHVKRTLISLPPASPCNGEWSWDLGHGLFVLYDFPAMLYIEQAYQSRVTLGNQEVDLSHTPASMPYTVSFQAERGYMHQTRHGFNTRRQVQRFPLDQPLQTYLCGTTQGQPPVVSPLAAALTPIHPHAGSAHHIAPYPTPTTSGGGACTFGNSMSNSTSVGGAYGFANSMSHSIGVGAYSHGGSVANSTGGAAYSLGGSIPNSTGGGAYSLGGSVLNSTVGGAYSHAGSVLNSTGGGAYSHAGNVLNSTGGGANSAGSSVPNVTGCAPQSVFAAAVGSHPKPTSSKMAQQEDEGDSSSPVTHRKREGQTPPSSPRRSLRVGPNVPPLDPFTASYVSAVRKLTPEEDEPCPVCLCKLSELSDYDESEDLGLDLVQMLKCSHRLHRLCFQQYLASQTSRQNPSGVRCPTCKKIHGVKIGDMPKEYGSMHVRQRSHPSLPGYEGCGCIEITYRFTPGTDRSGRLFFCHGFPRVCYLPANPKGQKVLRLLQVAWDRRLTFTIGTSVTTGATNTIVWNEIHHKTECHGNASGHGYPDPSYLDNVLMELESQGVTDDDLD